MVISASGMMEGGRILHHLKNNIEDPNATILITGYQAEHTLGRKLQSGMSPINIFGRPYRPKAEIITVDEFSAHADRHSLLNYLHHIPLPKQLCLVHTEPPQAESFKALLASKFASLPVTLPVMGQSIEI
jgi:metallo-beta-lactamase family protein